MSAKEGKSVDWLDIVTTLGVRAAGLAVLEEADRDRRERGNPPSPTPSPHPHPNLTTSSSPRPSGVEHENGGGGGAGGDGRGGDGGGSSGDGGGDLEGPLGGGGGRIVGVRRHSQAQAMLEETFGHEAGPEGCWPFRYFAGQWWRRVPGRMGDPKYVRADDAMVEAEVTRTMDTFRLRTDRNKVVSLAPEPARVRAALSAAIYYIAVAGDSMPAWIAPEMDDQGRPLWNCSLTWGGRPVEGPIEPGNVITLRNGLLDAHAWAVEGQIRLLPPTPRWFSRSCLPYTLPVEELRAADAAAAESGSMAPVEELFKRHCPTWMKFLEQVCAGEANEVERVKWKTTLQRWFGYCLTPDITLEKVLLIQGAPGTGKGTICEAMAGLVGSDNVLPASMEQIGERFGVAPMVGMSLVVIPELRVDGHTSIASALDRLNSISGGDGQSYEHKYGQRSGFVRLSAKFVLTPNEVPKLPDASNALVRRLVVLKMPPPVANPSPTVKQMIKSEGLGILLWALYGLRDLRVAQALGVDAFDMPAESRGVIDDVRRSASPVTAFVEDCCVVGGELSVATTELYEAYKAYAKANSLGEPSSITFGRQLAAALPALRKDKGGGREPKYVGLRLQHHATTQVVNVNSVFGPASPLPPP